MIYAPIIIPTLNRYEHLPRCIESLLTNEWVRFTELFISVDYPPSPEYQEGYEFLCKYLRSGISGFKSVDIVYQDKNLGPSGNINYLFNKIKDKYDRYIFMEDDIEVAPNFLEYMDKGLEIFKDDDRVFAICSTGAAQEYHDDYNIVLCRNFSAWGVGHWVKKDGELSKLLHRDYFTRVARDWRRLRTIYRGDAGVFFAFQDLILKRGNLYSNCEDEIPMWDQTVKICGLLEDFYVIGACKDKTRNWGYDGSGVNCNIIEEYNPETDDALDKELHFEYKYSEPMHTWGIGGMGGIENRIRIVAALVKIGIWRIFDGK